MRPPESFGRPRPVSAVETDPSATPLAAGGGVSVSSNVVSSAGNPGCGSGVGGAGIVTAPMMTYFLAEEADVDAAFEASGRDAESFKSAVAHPRHLHGKMADADVPGQSAPKTAGSSLASAAAPHGLANDHANDSDSVDSSDAVHSIPLTDEPARPSTPDAIRQHRATDSHAVPAPLSALPPNFSPLFSLSSAASLLGTPGPASLSAMSSPSSRRDSLSGSLMDDTLSGGLGGDGPISRDASFNLERGLGSTIHFGPSIGAPGLTDEQSGTDSKGGASAAAAAAASFLMSSSSAGLSTASNSMMMDSGSAPQLIMPSIKMPSRRPFTDTGKAMGRLKVLIAGDSGAGKTSLVKAIVQSCQHIVHVDQVTPPPFSLGTSRHSPAAAASSSAGFGEGAQYSTIRARRTSSRSSRQETATRQITEIYASTKPYPAWWNEVTDGRGLRRRKSLGESVLDRNICFVDTPGFTGDASTMDYIMPVVEYVEAYVQRLCSNKLSDAEFISLVSGDGGMPVDVVFYMISGNLKPADIEYLKQLTPLTNVIPLLARADSLRSDKDVAEAKERIARQLHEADIQPFVFTSPTEAQDFALTLASASGLPQPYAVSSATGSDHDIMDASLLMNPDYVQPLVSTDLSTLVEHVFCQDGVSRLRHAAARKLSQWRNAEFSETDGSPGAARPQSLYRPLSFGSNVSNIDSARPGIPSAPLGAPPSFALARLNDHTQREEQLAQIRLANWAAELQRSLDNERARYEKLAHSERAVWLTERLNECVQDGTLVAVAPTGASGNSASQAQQQQKGKSAERSLIAVSSKQQQQQAKAAKKKAKKTDPWAQSSLSSSSFRAASKPNLSLSTSYLSHEDPLGLLEVTAGLRARSLLVLELLGSLSVLGGMALWMAKHNYHLQAYVWVTAEWTKLWNGER